MISVLSLSHRRGAVLTASFESLSRAGYSDARSSGSRIRVATRAQGSDAKVLLHFVSVNLNPLTVCFPQRPRSEHGQNGEQEQAGASASNDGQAQGPSQTRSFEGPLDKCISNSLSFSSK